MSDLDNGSLLAAAMDGWPSLGDDMGRYGTILADPPWPSGGPKGDKRDNWIKNNMRPRYRTMRAIDILSLPVDSIALPDSMLVMWATWMHLALAHEVIRAWGFNYCTGMPWLKVIKGQSGTSSAVTPIYGPGVWFQHCTELILLARRGRPFGKLGNPRPARKGIIISPRDPLHSRKPVELQQWIEKAFPTPRIELFATQRRVGWVSWGDAV